MGAAWIPPTASLLAFLGAGGPALGLIRLLSPRSGLSAWGTAAVLALGAAAGAFAGAAALAGQAAGVWVPPAALLGLCALCGLPCRQVFASLAALARRPLRSPSVQAAGLLACCPAVALWVALDERPPADAGLEAALREHLPVERTLQQVSPSPLVTDKGRPVSVSLRALGPEPAVSRDAAQQRLLRRPDLFAKVIALDVASADCNCHGWVFTGGSYWLIAEAAEAILADNGYRPVPAPRVGDLAVYRDEKGTITHTGVVRATVPDGLVLLESKWGDLGAFLHPVDVHPYEGSAPTYHRSPRDGHRLRGAPGVAEVARAAAATPTSPPEAPPKDAVRAESSKPAPIGE
jgi:hypothetical protein